MNKKTLAAFALGAALAGTTVGAAGALDRPTKPVTTRVDLIIGEDGAVEASVHQRPSYDVEGWQVDHVACSAAVVQQVLSACPLPIKD